MTPLIAVPGRLVAPTGGLRGEVVAGRRRYLSAVERGGGVPALLAPTVDAGRAVELVGRFDGLLLLGGGDVEPRRYGAAVVDERVSGVDAMIDEVELALAMAALDAGVPLLAVCRGMQVLNVALGGSLHQHVDGHEGADTPVTLDAGSRVATAMGTTTVAGRCRHHQALDRVGEGLVVSGRAADGTVEAVERPGGWVVGVQWHPEDTAEVDRAQQRLFDAFVAAGCGSR